MLSELPTILIVDDQAKNLKLLFNILEDSGLKVLIAKTGESALKKLQKILPDLILLDIVMPNMDGFETCQCLKSSAKTKDIPVIFMTALAESQDKIKGLSLGAVDYITKPFQQEEILVKIENHLKVRRLQKQLEQQNQQLKEEISIRQAADSQLKKIAEQLKAVLDSSLDGITALLAIRNEAGNITDFQIILVNAAAAKLLKRERNELLGKHLFAEMAQFRKIGIFEEYVAVVETGKSLETEFDYPYNNSKVWVQIVAVKLGDGLAVTFRNISQRKQVEIDLIIAKSDLEKQIQQALLLEKITQQIRFSLNAEQIFDTAVIQIGQAFDVSRCLLYSYKTKPVNQMLLVAEYLAANYPLMTPVEIPISDATYLQLILSQDKAVPTYNVYQEPFFKKILTQLKHWQIKSILAIRTSYQGKPNGIIYLTQCDLFRDWSTAEIKLLEAVAAQLGIALAHANLLQQETQQRQEAISQNQALKQAKLDAEAANQAKSLFLSKMSHELRTPLNAILGFTQMMARQESLTEQQTQHLKIINRSGEHLLALINDILSMSKIESGQITLNETSFDLYNLLDSIEEMLRFKATSLGLQLVFQRSSYLPQYIQTDENKLRQILLNLLGNALKFTKVGYVSLRAAPLASYLPLTINHKNSIIADSPYQSNVNLSSDKKITQQLLQFEVEDTGLGITSEELKILFEAFVQTKTGQDSREGTGLGLAISKQFIQLMGGEISVTSSINQGTIFNFQIPVKLTNSLPEKIKITSRKIIGLEPNQSKNRILIVEDILENRQLLVQLLSRLGFEVREAANGQEAIALLDWSPHLILMDILMPVMDGYTATKQIKQQANGKNIIIIALTASAFEEQREAILLAGCDDYIPKPFQEEILLERIAHHLQVRYRYEDLSNPSRRSSCNEILVANDLAVMPKDWRVQFHQAALSADDEQMNQLIEYIPPEQNNLHKNLKSLIENFCLDQLLNLTQQTRL